MLVARWKKLMANMGMKENKATCDALVQAYSEAHRQYHTLVHLESVLSLLDQYQHLAQHTHEIELALWFHDAIYQPKSTSNELESAQWARTFLNQNQINPQSTARIEQLIDATSHTGASGTVDEKLISDIDLAILGRPKTDYETYTHSVRFEYQHVPISLYREKRKAVLQGFLNRPKIYLTEALHDRFEEQARRNIFDEIRGLE
ncbi:MAG: hypothetical protein MI864_22005 [Pseudomonadales bacterium]|nr:hypothetical protein [Pseudomonadales bacterium]